MFDNPQLAHREQKRETCWYQSAGRSLLAISTSSARPAMSASAKPSMKGFTMKPKRGPVTLFVLPEEPPPEEPVAGASPVLNPDGVSIKGCTYIYAPKGK